MNIAIFTPSQNPYSETFIQAHKQYLKDNVYYYYGRNNIKLEGTQSLLSDHQRQILRFQKKLFLKVYDFTRDQLILQSLKKNKIDIVLAEYGTHANYILPFVKKAGLPLVVHFHGYDATVRQVLQKNNYYSTVFKYASKIIVVSKQMEQALLDMGCSRAKLVYNVYGPNPEFLKVAPKFTKQQFVAVGRFTDKKAPYYTLLAFHKVLQEYPKATLIMAGDGDLLNASKNLVRYLKIKSQVTFPGVISPENFKEVLSTAIGFVQHSITADNGDMEGTPLSVLEASAAGLPVIATNHAGIPDVIKDKVTGLLCEEHDVATMAKNMLSILRDVDFAQKLGAAGKENIMNNFSMEKHIGTLQDLLEKYSS